MNLIYDNSYSTILITVQFMRSDRLKQLKHPTNRLKAAVFLLLFVLNFLTVKTSDDLGYSINHGFLDLFRQEYIQYMTWTGRSVAHIIARSFLALPKGIFNLANSLIFCIHVELICIHASGKKNYSPILYALSALLVFLFVPVFGQTVLWETGSCNYLWTTTIILAFLLPYRLDEVKERTLPYALLMGLFGILAGWTNENTGGACILVAMGLTFYSFKNTKRFPSWKLIGILGSIVGFLIMIKAPGNAVRAADFVVSGGRAYAFVHDLFNTLNVLGSLHGQLLLWIGIAVLLGVHVHNSVKGVILPATIYFISGAAAVGAILLSPVPVEFDRSMYGATILVIIGFLTLLAPVNETKTGKLSCVVLTAALAGLSIFDYAQALVDLSYTRYQYQYRESWVKEQASLGNRNPVVPVINSEFFTTYNAMYGLNDILDYPEFVNNVNYSITHGLDSVTSTTVEKWNEIYRNGSPELMNARTLSDYLTLLNENPDFIGLVTCNTLGIEHGAVLETLGKVYGEPLEGSSNLYGIIHDGDFEVEENGEPGGIAWVIQDHYVWVSSYDDPTQSDILMDQVEYTNDNSGLSIVVFSQSQDRVVDSVTWKNSETPDRTYRES